MIITQDQIRKVRPIAENIDDSKRIEPYIVEAENLIVKPIFGASLIQQLDGVNLTTNSGLVITNNAGEPINVVESEYAKLLNGGYYTDLCGKLQNFEGLIQAIAYLTYSRLLKNNQVNVTAFGVTKKTTSFSEPVDEKTIFRVANESEKIGRIYLQNCISYLVALKIIVNRKKIKTTKFKAIGD